MLKFVLSILTALALSTPALAKDTKASAEVLKVNTSESEIQWTGRKVLVDSKHFGVVKLKSGEILLNKGTITGGQFEVDMTSIASTDMEGSPKKGDLEGHLKSADFFEVDKHPTAVFKIKSVKTLKASGEGQPTHEISGDFTLKGKTRPLTFPAAVKFAGDKAEATAKVTIDRTLWDVRYASDKFFKGLGDKVIANDIDLGLKITATK